MTLVGSDSQLSPIQNRNNGKSCAQITISRATIEEPLGHFSTVVNWLDETRYIGENERIFGGAGLGNLANEKLGQAHVIKPNEHVETTRNQGLLHLGHFT